MGVPSRTMVILPRSLIRGDRTLPMQNVSKASGHAEMAAERYRGIMGNLPEDERIASVQDALSLRPVCGSCAQPATSFVDRSGVAVRPGSNGFTSVPQVAGRIAQVRASGVNEPEPILQAAAESYDEYLAIAEGFGGYER